MKSASGETDRFLVNLLLLMITSTNTKEISVTAYKKPTLSIDAPSRVCKGSSIRLNAVSSTCTRYLWSDNTTENYRDVVVNGTTSYTLTGYDEHDCSNKVSKVVAVAQYPTVTVEGRSEVCAGETVTLIASGAKTWSWSTGETSSMIKIDNVQTDLLLTVEGTSEDGCTTPKEFTVSVKPIPTLSTREQPKVCKGGDLILTAQGAETLKWSANA